MTKTDALKFKALEGKVEDLGKTIENIRTQMFSALKLPEDIVLAKTKEPTKSRIRRIYNKNTGMSNTV